MENYKYINRYPFFKQHWVLPILLAIFLLPTLILLPWHTQKIEFDDRQEQLIADTLWLEQAIKTLLVKDEDYIRIIGDDIVNNRGSLEQIKKRILTLIQNHTELQQIVWLNDSDQVQYSTRAFNFDQFSPNSQQAIVHARGSKLPQYSQPAALRNGEAAVLMDYHYPLFDKEKYLGCIVASYKLTSILEKAVPWWFAKEHEISLIDIDDNVVANRSDTGIGHNIFMHSKGLDLPGANLILKTNSNKYFPRLLSNYLVAIVVILGLGLSWSLWALWRDILRRQAAETALRSEMAFRKAMEKSSITGMRVRSMDGRLVYVNAAFCEIVGWTEDQLLGQRIPFPFWTAEAADEFARHSSSFEKIPLTHGFETVYQHSSGRTVPVLIYESPLMDENGSQTGWMGSILDISERKRTEQILRQHEERLQRSARLATMGELASVMAHELNQPLTAINTYASGVLSMVQSGQTELEQLQPALTQMQKQAFRAAQIIRSVHDFVVKRGPNKVQMQFRDVFNNVYPLIELQAKSYLISIKFDIDEPLPDVFVDPISMEQVILNLTRNALQSMQELTLQKRILQVAAKLNGSFVCVEIIDNGSGIDQEVADRLFSPFFSTKAEGMGMGLNICRTIIEFHGGQLSYRPNPSGGTIFSFTVPVCRELDLETDYTVNSINS
ncbi:two-component system sensor histidine kinase DctS [Oxalobacteraceae bacterium GrIS 2.11]